MELLLISSSKLKVTLSERDMQSYSLTCDTLDYDNTETRRAFWDIFDVAKHETGFDAASDRVFIQVYPSKNGGCEMYITKLLNRLEPEDDDDFDDDELHSVINRDFETALLSRKNVGSIKYHKIFKFSSVEELLKVCAILLKRNCRSDSSAFFSSYGAEYFLVICFTDTNEGTFCDKIMNEYGEQLENDIYLCLGEYVKCLCSENAVEVLGRLSL